MIIGKDTPVPLTLIWLSFGHLSFSFTVGELVEAQGDLESSQLQIAALRSPDVKPTPTGKCSEAGNGVVAPESFSGANFHLEAGLEEAKVPCNIGLLRFRRFAFLVTCGAVDRSACELARSARITGDTSFLRNTSTRPHSLP